LENAMTTRYTAAETRSAVLRDVRVGDAMHSGVVTCSPGTSLQAVARTMAAHRIHAVVVPVDDPAGWALVSDLDLIAAADAGEVTTAGEIASRPGLYVTPADDVALVARLLHQNRLHHLIVIEHGGGRPVGIISTLDVADVLAELPPAGRPYGKAEAGVSVTADGAAARRSNAPPSDKGAEQ
jgi:CBS domain-containing protein